MYKKFSVWLAGFGLMFAFLTACTTLPAPPKQLPPQKLRETLASRHIQNFTLSGALAIRTANDAGSLRWSWQQTGKKYVLNFYAALGAGAFRITGSPAGVLLEDANGKKQWAKDPETLLRQQTGWQVPLTRLFDCVRGIPVHDGQWHVVYQHVTNANGIELPDQLLFSSQEANGITVRVIIKRWSFGNR